MKPRLNPLFLLLSTLLMPPAFGQSGGGVHGGGHVVDVDGTPELLDLVKSATCDWRAGTKVYAAHPEVARILKKLATLDWYFAGELEREIRRLGYCYTGELYRLTPTDFWSPVASTRRFRNQYVQAAVRWDDNVYVNEAEMGRLTPRRRAFLLIHEAMHSYLSMETLERNLKLRSMIRAISMVDDGEMTRREDLHFVMGKNEILFPRTVGELDRSRVTVEFLLATPDEQVQRIREGADLDAALSDDSFLPALSKWDRERIRRLGGIRRIVEDAYGRALAKAETAEFEALLSRPYESLRPALLAVAVSGQLDETRRAMLFQSKSIASVVHEIHHSLVASPVRAGPLRILADAELAWIFGAETEDRTYPLTSFPLQVRLDSGLKGLVQIAIHAIRSGQTEALDAQICTNPEFYAALGLKSQRAQVTALKPHIEREKQLALDVLDEARERLVQAFLAGVRKEVTPAEFEAFKNRIQFNRF